MTQDEIKKIKDLHLAGYNDNQIAAMLMIPKQVIASTLDGDLVVEKTGTKGKLKPVVEDKPLFEDEPGL
jgi:hypothetical protein